MMRKKLPADRAVGTQDPMNKPQWRATALAIAAAVVLGVSASDAQALALGRVTVQSALGEPLRADIEVPDINGEEVANLRAVVASPDMFRTAGMEYNPAMANMQITLQRRPDGQYFLRLTGDRPINDPFVDLILEASWPSGRLVRDYTLLFDPPALRQSTQAPLAAQVSPVAPPPPVAASQIPRLAPSPSASRAPVAPRSPVTAAPSREARGAAPKAPPSSDSKQVTVRPGDTAGAIAAVNKPPTISLDQMLVAMLRANPDAFSGGNMNRLKAGAVLEVPSAGDAAAIPAAEARQTVVAQSRDFNEFRRKLAEGVPASKVDVAQRQVSGKVQATVEEKKPTATTPDKLTLSKGSIQAKANAERIAKERASKEAATRVAELNKNIADLNKLGTASGTATATGAAPAARASASARKSVV